jgi:hypothetical protein
VGERGRRWECRRLGHGLSEIWSRAYDTRSEDPLLELKEESISNFTLRNADVMHAHES